MCAATHKLLLDVETKKVKEVQLDMLDYFDREYPEVCKAIEDKKVLDDELLQKILDIVKEFKEKR